MQWVDLQTAKNSGMAYLHLTGTQKPGTLQYFARIVQIDVGGAERPLVPRKSMTADDARKRAEAEARKRGILYAVQQLDELIVGTISMGVPVPPKRT